MEKANPEYITLLKAEVKNSPYPRHMAMELDAIAFDADKNLVAHGTSTLMALPGKGLGLGMKKFL
jgi:hypothetical protein